MGYNLNAGICFSVKEYLLGPFHRNVSYWDARRVYRMKILRKKPLYGSLESIFLKKESSDGQTGTKEDGT